MFRSVFKRRSKLSFSIFTFQACGLSREQELTHKFWTLSRKSILIMQFPIYNIDANSLGDNYYLLNEIIRYDAIYASEDEEIWLNLFLHMTFLDTYKPVILIRFIDFI